MSDTLHRFLFEALDIRGALVQLGPAWRNMLARRDYPIAVRDMLGELAAITAILGGNLKTSGRLGFQVQGHGAISLLVMDCNEHQGELRLRGLAKGDFGALGAASPAPSLPAQPTVAELFGDGKLVLSLQTGAGEPYQSIVPLRGDTLAAVFEHYLHLSEQLPTRLWLAADGETACGLFLQKLPEADLRDADGWNRIAQLAATVHASELALPPQQLLSRLFAEEDVRLFAPRAVHWHCPRDEEKVRNMLLTLGREEVESMLAEAKQIAIHDEVCGHEYRFGAEIIDELFPPGGRVLH